MSKFFKGAVSTSESSESESSDEEAPQLRARPAIRDFAYPSDSEDEGQKRVVKPQKDKKFDELKDLIKQSKNTKNIKDMSKLLSLFEEMTKLFEKTRPVIQREGLSIPRFFIRYLAELEDFVNEQWEDREGRKSMSKGNSKGLTSLRQKLRKYNREQFDDDLTAYRQQPDPLGYSSAEEPLQESDEDRNIAISEKEPVAVTEKKTAKQGKVTTGSGSESGDSEWGSSTASSESELSDIEGKEMEDLRKYFLKKEFKEGGDKEDDEKRRKRRERREPKQREKRRQMDEVEWTAIPTRAERARQLFDPKTEITEEVVVKKLGEIVAARGRKSTNRKEQARHLQELGRLAAEKGMAAALLVKILFARVAALFEQTAKFSHSMDFSSWNKTADAISGLVDLLSENMNVSLSDKINEEDENLTDSNIAYQVHGSLLLAVDRLDAEFTKILQNADCHSTDYVEKLKGEKDLCQLIEKTQKYVDSRPDIYSDADYSKIYMLYLEHLYYKYDSDECESKATLIDRLCKTIYTRDQGKRLRQRAMLCHIYYNAVHDRWHEARELMLMSHLQTTIDHSDINTQILYNRAICQLGLCAFRHGYIKEAHQGLSDIQNTQRGKELLAQGLAIRQTDRTAEQEKLERARQIPYHMHINVELMECVYLICSMLLEIPQMACREYEIRRRPLSRSFHYQLKQSEKCSLVGPPENTREHVVAASRAMLAGDWIRCRNYIINEKMNAKVWNLFRNSENVKAMVVRRIQEEAMRTYLLTYSTVYNTVSIDTLSQLFDLDKKAVHALISKMIMQEELMATFDAPSQCLMMHRVEPSRLQMLAMHMTDKLNTLADNNEQIIEPRGRSSYTGPGNWYGQRQDRPGTDDMKTGGRSYQSERTGTRNTYQSDRRPYGPGYSDGKRWPVHFSNRRRDAAAIQKRY